MNTPSVPYRYYRHVTSATWARSPLTFKVFVSRLLGTLAEWRVSKFFVPIYCLLQYSQSYDFTRFAPASGASTYNTFQDFFARKLVNAIEEPDSYLWPCEGLFCDRATFDDHTRATYIKGETRTLRTIFGAVGASIPDGYYFANVFLHNRDYHRIHAPVSGVIRRIEHIDGDLRLLRPWYYRINPSLPAMTNERVNIVIEDSAKRPWYLSIVGGPGVSTILLNDDIKINTSVAAGKDLATFKLGSTCCFAAPIDARHALGSNIEVGTPLV